MPDEPRVKYEVVRDGRVAVVTLNRPRYRNALSLQAMAELDAAFQRAAADDEVRVVVLRGEGPVFSAGHDLGSPDVQSDLTDDGGRVWERNAQTRYEHTWRLDVDHYLRFRSIPKPTIAAVHGQCLLAGWMLASSMDVIFAADDAEFLMSDIEYFSMPWDIGVRKTKEIVFENRFITCDEAVSFGFVQRAIPSDKLDAEVMAFATRVAEQDRFRLRMMKLSINQMQDMQGFTPHIISHHAAWAVSRSSTRPPIATNADGTRAHGIVAHARTAQRSTDSPSE